jgi:hypothetical protein
MLHCPTGQAPPKVKRLLPSFKRHSSFHSGEIQDFVLEILYRSLSGMSDLQLCRAKQLRKHEVGFIANKNLFFPIDSETFKFLCGKVKLILSWILR